MPAKTEIYTWRLSTATKARLEDAARMRGQSVAQLLDDVVTESLDRTGRDAETELDRQRRLHARAGRLLGRISGGGARRSERVREFVRARLKRRSARAR